MSSFSSLLSWNLKRGQDFEHQVFRKFRSPVHHPSSSPRGAFHLLAVFRRFTFRLSEDSVSLALHSVLGGAPAGFHVACIRDWHFRFSVASRHVGFMIRDLSRVTTDQFDVYFHLWRDGGMDWFREWNKWQQEEDASSHRVERHKCKSFTVKHVSFVPKLVQDSPKTKFVPSELNSCVKLGKFSCNINSSVFPKPNAAQAGPNSNSNSNSASIAASLVFGRLKRQLGMPTLLEGVDTHDGCSSSSTQPGVLVKTPSCPRCLGPGHLVRDCPSPVRCWHCFNYGHVKKSCLRWRMSTKSKWTVKKNPLCIEPRPEVTVGVTDADQHLLPSSSLASSRERGKELSSLGDFINHSHNQKRKANRRELESHGQLRS
jgi:hypothetical protein